MCAGSKSEISYRFKIRGAGLLNKKKGGIEQRLTIMNDIYNLRSDIVHGSDKKKKLGSVGSEKLELNDRVRVLLPIAYSVFSDIIKWYITAAHKSYFPENKNTEFMLKELDQQLVKGVAKMIEN